MQLSKIEYLIYNCRLSKEKETRGKELLKQLRKKRKSKYSKK